MNGTFMSLVIAEAVLTAAAVVMFLYRAMLDMKEEDHIVLDSAEAHLVREQAVIRQRAGVVSRYLKIVGIIWLVLLAAIFGVWMAEGLGLL
jgi:hypothetical protein